MQKPRKAEDLQWIVTIYIAELLNKFKLNLANKVPKKLEKVSFFKTLDYLRVYRNELIHLRGKWFKIPEIDYVFSMRSPDMHWLQFYFEERKRINFFNLDGHVYAKVGDLVFLIPFPYGISVLKEVFYDNLYAGFDVTDKTVVDIGAFIGDTAVYFASKGAKKVFAYEPLSHLYNIAMHNVLINKFENVIHINNEAVGDRSGELIIHEPLFPGSSSNVFLCWVPRNQIMRSHRVKVTPLSDVIFNLGEVELLKIHCEGCEHTALKDAYEKRALKNVNQFVAEVHYNTSYILNVLQKAHFKIVKVKSSGENTPDIVRASKKQ